MRASEARADEITRPGGALHVRVRVRDPGKGLAVTLEVGPDASVASVKQGACSALGLDPEGYVLMAGYRALQEASTLSSEGVREGDVLTLIQRGVWRALSGSRGG